MESSKFSALKEKFYEINALQSASHLMEWDQQTYMPNGAAEARAEHLGILSRLAHQVLISDGTQKLVEEAAKEVEPGSEEAAFVRVVQRQLDLATKIPTRLVEEKSKLISKAHNIWVTAKKTSQFKPFEPYLQQIFELSQEEANHLGYKEHIYDALIDQYEEGTTTAECKQVFESIKQPLVSLVHQIKEKGQQPDDKILHKGEWDQRTLEQIIKEMLQTIGFDLQRGRVDLSAHPFCTNWSLTDVRLTTRYVPYPSSAILTCLHEGGHGMYEQGSSKKWDRTPLEGGVSLGVHESQSRLWENIIGRSYAFWQYFLPKFIPAAPALANVKLEDWYRANNKVEPTFIRVESDEITYNLHVLLRFELECDILSNKLAIHDVPEAWNAKMKEYLGITPPDHAHGCLQDVHWSEGLIGYFPTYTIGNLLSYQIWDTLCNEITNTKELIAKGNFKPILTWLQEKIYQHGKRYSPKDLTQKITGKPLGATNYLEGLSKKYKEIYQL